VCIVKHKLVGILGKARGLLRAGLVETLLIDLHVQAASEHLGALMELLGLTFSREANRGQIFFEAGAIETRLMKVLHGANKGSRFSANRSAESAESASGIRGEENQGLRRFVRNCDPDTFLPDVFVPCLDLGEPIVWRRVGGAAQERHDHDVVRGLGFGEIGMNPEAVRWLQVRYLRDREDGFTTAYTYFHRGASQIEGSPFRKSRNRGSEQEQSERKKDCRASRPNAWFYQTATP
jgi:hypothetical protein